MRVFAKCLMREKVMDRDEVERRVFEEWEGSVFCCNEWMSEIEWERQREIGENGKSVVAGTHIKQVEGYPPGTEIKFIRLVFHLNKIESRGLELILTKSSPKNSSSMPTLMKCLP